MTALASLIKKDVGPLVDTLPHDAFHRRTLLITGASGLIGTYLLATAAALRERGVLLTVVAVSKSPLPTHLHDFTHDTSLYEGDIADVSFVETLPRADLIIHAAGYGQPARFMENPALTIALNTTSTDGLLQRLTPGGKFLFVSSSEVYSGLPNPPYKETQIGTTNTDHPRSCYIEGKRCGEAIVAAYRQKGVDAKSGRLSLAYGPGTKPSDKRVLNSFIEKALREGKIEMMDAGEALRTYCYVTDAVEIIWRILLDGTDAIYNIGGFSHTTIRGLAEEIGSILNVPVSVPSVQNTAHGAPDDVRLDMSKIAEQFGKEEASFVPLQKGLQRTVGWQRGLYGV